MNTEFEFHDDIYLQAIDKWYRQDETFCVESILAQAQIDPALLSRIHSQAASLVEKVRAKRVTQGGLDAFMSQYDLTSEEGIALMCLAEALLRIPDKATVDLLIRDKLATANWEAHLGKSPSLFVNAATWGLMLTGKLLQAMPLREQQENALTAGLKRVAAKGGEPIVRQAVRQAMKILGRQFVMGQTMQDALKRAKKHEARGYRYSYDMLGESAYTAQDAQKYFEAYCQAIDAVGEASAGKGPILGPGISVKLSALHPRFVMAKKMRLMQELLPRLKELVLRAKAANIGLTIDAEEAHTLRINLDLIAAIIESGVVKDWEGFGLAVQAYQKRCPAVLDWLIHLARKHNQRLMVRLVKGAYWDTEIKLSQVQGLTNYPVFTRKITTDTNYIACVKKMLAAKDVIYSQFATHNALTVSTIMELAHQFEVQDYEFQCLHGMGDALYDEIVEHPVESKPCRVYAPVGTHEDLLAYLVRRLLENGANTSFVNRIVDENKSIEEIIADPIEKLSGLNYKPHPRIPLPPNLFTPERPNSQGIDLSHPPEFLPLLQEIAQLSAIPQVAKPSVEKQSTITPEKRYSPVNVQHYLGEVVQADKEIISETLTLAHEAFESWQHMPVEDRAQCLEKMAELLQQHRAALMSLLVYEGGKTIDDAVSELREAIDFCYYYAGKARQLFIAQTLPGPTGELNQLRLHGRGVIVCISPWNFPLAIFLGQVTAALAAGNCVIAKPASQTVLIAAKAVELLHQAGFPKQVVQLLPCRGALVGEILIPDERIEGVVFTGSTSTARDINQRLCTRPGPIVPFIAETGGQNAMIVDSSALAEQVVQDAIMSAFRSAGQRCSALRVLFLQEEVADKIICMLQGAMTELAIGHPNALATDVGPVIDEGARIQLQHHTEKMKREAKLLYEITLPLECQNGTYFSPCLFEMSSLDQLKEEVFGPILHVVRFKGEQLPEILEQINRTGYGLTLGIHSRIDDTIEQVCATARVGNIYVNRNMIGAVVGVQPFGGEGLSGTGPKAGGPYYLVRLATERTLSINTTAAGGNATLMSLSENE